MVDKRSTSEYFKNLTVERAQCLSTNTNSPVLSPEIITFLIGPKRRPPTNFDGKINGRD